MSKKQRNISGYASMWVVAMFDLPVDTPTARKQYTRFRTHLLKEGFSMLQLSIYARFCPSEEKSEALRNRIKQGIPPKGEVRLLAVTDRQFAKMEIFAGKRKLRAEEPPQQLLLF